MPWKANVPHISPRTQEIACRAQKRNATNRRKRGRPPPQEEEETGEEERGTHAPGKGAHQKGMATYTDETGAWRRIDGTWQRMEEAPRRELATYTDETGTWLRHAAPRPSTSGCPMAGALAGGGVPGTRPALRAGWRASQEQGRDCIGKGIRNGRGMIIGHAWRASPGGPGKPAAMEGSWAPWARGADSKGSPTGATRGVHGNRGASEAARQGSGGSRSSWEPEGGRKRPRYSQEEWDTWRRGDDEDEEDRSHGWKKTRRGCRGGQKSKRH